MKRMVNGIIHAFLPARCCVCGCLVEAQFSVCSDCVSQILTVPAAGFCRGCGRSLQECLCEPDTFAATLAAPFFYEGNIRGSLHRFKFRNRPLLARSFAGIAAKYAEDCCLTEGVTLLTYIPMTKAAERRRGYNQAALFAEALGELLGLPCQKTLEKIYETHNQHELPRLQRLGNLTGVYEVPVELEACVRGKTILLVDDIATTGSTCSEAAKTLLLFGAEEVRCLCIARAKAPKKESAL